MGPRIQGGEGGREGAEEAGQGRANGRTLRNGKRKQKTSGGSEGEKSREEERREEKGLTAVCEEFDPRPDVVFGARGRSVDVHRNHGGAVLHEIVEDLVDPRERAEGVVLRHALEEVRADAHRVQPRRGPADTPKAPELSREGRGTGGQGLRLSGRGGRARVGPGAAEGEGLGDGVAGGGGSGACGEGGGQILRL